MPLNLTSQETGQQLAHKAMGNGQQPLAEEPSAQQSVTPETELSEFEAAVAGPDGNIETAAMDPGPEDEAGALKEIEEAVNYGSDDDALEVVEVNLTYPIRKPLRSIRRFEWFMTHPDLNLWVKSWVVVDERDMDELHYLPTNNIRAALQDHLVRIEYVPCITSLDLIFIWPLACEDVTGKPNSWTQSARTAAKEARTQLTKILSNRKEGKYRIFHPKDHIPPPVWPEDFNRKTMLSRMWKDHTLRDLNNDLVRDMLNAGKRLAG
jgi:hypothetical protein